MASIPDTTAAPALLKCGWSTFLLAPLTLGDMGWYERMGGSGRTIGREDSLILIWLSLRKYQPDMTWGRCRRLFGPPAWYTYLIILIYRLCIVLPVTVCMWAMSIVVKIPPIPQILNLWGVRRLVRLAECIEALIRLWIHRMSRRAMHWCEAAMHSILAINAAAFIHVGGDDGDSRPQKNMHAAVMRALAAAYQWGPDIVFGLTPEQANIYLAGDPASGDGRRHFSSREEAYAYAAERDAAAGAAADVQVPHEQEEGN